MKDNLNIITQLKKTIIYLDNVVMNFPNNERVFKNKIISTSYDVLEYIYMANEVNKENKVFYQKKITTKIKMLDFYLKRACEKKYISYKKYNKCSTFLLNILKQTYAWIKYEKI